MRIAQPPRQVPAGDYPVAANEVGRVSSLRLLKVLGTEADPWWERRTRLAAAICGTPTRSST